MLSFETSPGSSPWRDSLKAPLKYHMPPDFGVYNQSYVAQQDFFE